jgi:tRNA-dependent cyclodipeptide synthase
MQELNLEYCTSRYNAVFKFEGGDQNKNIAIHQLKNKKILVGISVGKEYHEGGKFAATVELINKHNFQSCDILVGDTLQRYNYYDSMSELKARDYCRKLGDAWLDRNSSALKNLVIPHKIIRWDELMLFREYYFHKNNILNAYAHDPNYKAAINSNIAKFIARAENNNPGCNIDSIFARSLEYLLEECPLVLPIFDNLGYDFIIYPKPISVGMAKTRELFLQDGLKNKSRWLALRFRSKSLANSLEMNEQNLLENQDILTA